ncbi:MAG: hypothetical protein LBD75_02305 [Candidatus Peribacteria bacterium]|nr:hypothetical protein [Candidatus Peribacteria bacterium]
MQGQSCSTLGAIALNAMVCNFKIYNGKELQSQGNYVYDIEGPCFTQGTDVQADWSSSPLISSFINWNQHNYIKDGNANGGNTFWSYNITNNKSYAFRSSVFIIDNFGNTDTNNKLVKYGERAKNSKQITTFGEYKLSLDSVKYLQCDNNKWKAQEPYPRVCEVNFSVTEPYILQKTPSGTINSTTESLKNYKMYANGTDVMTYSELNKILTVSPNSYANTTQISTAMENFIAKYSKLAVKINSSLFGSTSVKKVPGKHIYFVDGPLNIDGFRYEYDTSKTKVREVHGDNAIYTTPFTIIQTQGNTTIKGNLNHNMMLLTNGTITFDGIKNCNDAQTLKGIYYAKGGFISTSVAKNNKLSNPERCIGGNLHIKGIAIGNGLNNVMNNRRSELNQWFYSPAGTILSQTQRRNYLMNGAAVLIEYSPSIFTTATMPPGAEEFTKALEVYKR